MGLEPAENGAPDDPFPWQGCGKFERSVYRRASYQQNGNCQITVRRLRTNVPR